MHVSFLTPTVTAFQCGMDSFFRMYNLDRSLSG